MTSPRKLPSAGGPRPIEASDRRALAPYLRVQRATDSEILRILGNALDEANKALRKLARKTDIGSLVREDQLMFTKQAIFREMSNVWRDLGDVVRAGRYAAAAAAVDSQGVYDRVLFAAAGDKAEYDLLAKGLKAYARNAIDLGNTRLTTSAVELSRNVYNAEKLSTGQLDDLLNALLARGSSAKEIAKEVSAWIDPDVPGGVSYAAMRLGRTELNNAFHAMQSDLMAISPWVDASQWNLSGSHPKPDQCDDYAANNEFNGHDGQYDSSSVPSNPHPMCLCFLTPVLMNTNSFMQSLNSGAFDDFLSSFS